jgi:hypothetical protein
VQQALEWQGAFGPKDLEAKNLMTSNPDFTQNTQPEEIFLKGIHFLYNEICLH